MSNYPSTPEQSVGIAEHAAETVHGLIRATLNTDGRTGLRDSADTYRVLGSLQQVAAGLPQLFERLSAFLQRELQRDVVTVDGGQFKGDPLAAIGTASYHLDYDAAQAARHLAGALGSARHAIAFASHTDPAA